MVRHVQYESNARRSVRIVLAAPRAFGQFYWLRIALDPRIVKNLMHMRTMAMAMAMRLSGEFDHWLNTCTRTNYTALGPTHHALL
jgi:hypothetical protein